MMLTTANPSKTTKPNVLVVDDQAQNRFLLTRILRDRYHVTAVNNGSSALNVLQTSLFDVVLLDMVMPDMDGLEVLNAIRSKTETLNLPVILVSSKAESLQMIKGLEMGANDYILRPIDIELTRARVHAQIKQKHLLEEQEATIQQLKKVQQDHKRLIRMVTHDLKHPLANLRMAEIILRRYMGDSGDINASDGSLKIMDGMISSLDSMQEVIDDFFGVFSLDDLKTNIQPTSIDSIIFDVTMQYAATAIKKEIDLRPIHLDGWINTDRKRLTQVMGNLVSNAIKYSPMGSTVYVYAQQYDDCIRLCVEDQGQGVPLAERDRLFTEFGKLSPRPTGYESSTGLGLWIVKNLAEAMDGCVGADFPDEGGAIFWVEMPTTSEQIGVQAVASRY